MVEKKSNDTILNIIGFIWIPLLIAGFFIIPQIIGVESTERITETIKFTTTTKYTDKLTEGVVCKKPEGQDGIVVKEYKVKKHFGKEASRELISEKTNREVKNEIKIVGTAHKYTGYCSVEGYYRRRYAACYGDYSPESKQKAEEQAYICNTSPNNESGCYDTYYSSIWNGTVSCPQIKVEEL